MDNPEIPTTYFYRQSSLALGIALIGFCLLLLGLVAPAVCNSETEDCKFFENALFNPKDFEEGWREGLTSNIFGMIIIGVVPAFFLALLLRRRLSMLMSFLAITAAIGFVYSWYAYFAYEVDWLGIELKWGWGVLAAGCLLLLLSAILPSEADWFIEEDQPTFEWPNTTQRIIVLVGILLFTFSGISPITCGETIECKINGEGSLFSSNSFDEGFFEGVSANHIGLIVFSLALLNLVAMLLSPNLTDAHNAPLIVTGGATLSFTIVLFLIVFINTDSSEETRLGWGWMPFWAGAVLLFTASLLRGEQEEISAPMNDSLVEIPSN